MWGLRNILAVTKRKLRATSPHTVCTMRLQEVSMTPISRRTFLTTAATAAGAVTLGCGDRPIGAPPLAQLVDDLLPDPASCGIDHIIVFMMENRSSTSCA